ncbi:MAG: bifunctional proline dehydrogenase/L-glutamate gamma-semialdehyde dehydrogenase [Dysgonamonadaceae bacterium]|jgi:RHH-type proline utilization regulon transcriptional repressor/proline dehydrogenase/delta 1-pyrroline-5-carboxylate dehydrogenase|nr:bifunctional proline dehydrogenase/L-glutamate gamma-semialdehyde dehydrogenase [Dysgonamonadaceae bacterium]
MVQINTHEVIEWASQFLTQADQELSREEKKEQKKYASLIQTAEYKTFLSRMLDESSQIRDDRKLNKRVRQIIRKYGIPDFFSPADRILLRLYLMGGYWFPSIAMPIFKQKLRNETSKIIIAEERPKLTTHLKKRFESRIGQNVNLLGEVVLGDAEANYRYLHYLEALKEPDINYISIKLSGIYAQIHSLSYEQNKKELCELLAAVYRQAMKYPYTDPQGVSRAKFVNLDMEEYKDAELTLDVFMEVMSDPEFKQYTAGIVVQAYLPDASDLQQRLLAFAKKRVAEGGAPLKMRLVKGANLQMESIVSSLKGWPNPIYPSKTEVDANYLHLLDVALQPDNVKVLNIGVASHNFFTIAYAHLLAEKNGVQEDVTFEMLEGMANNLPRVMRKLRKQIILYTPVVKAQYFLNAVSYLVRRLDENTGKENFLSYSFGLQLDSKEWNFLRDQFIQACELKDTITTQPFRTQDRNQPPVPVKEIDTFANEPDTDLDLPPNRQWALNVLKKWETTVNPSNFTIPVQIGDKEAPTYHKRTYTDRSREDKVVVCEAGLATLEQVKEAIGIAEQDASHWRKTALPERNRILHRVAETLSANRGDLIGCMAAVTGKTFTEGDVEVSEAIDFCRYYPISMQVFDNLETVSCRAKGIVLVIPPWNFPLAIPVGGVAAALASGNTVILKPATVALPVAWKFAQSFWEAGVPKDALQVVCPAERSSLNVLTSHPFIRHIILTGGTDTAFRLLSNSPRTPLSAETGGKNAIILTGQGDQDHAILNVVSSAFGNAGQKCSACSLLLVDKKTYNDKTFQSKLKDAVTSIRTGSVWDTMNTVGPMIENDNEKLKYAIEHLEEGESWLVAPEFVDEKRYILKPCVKWGVKPGSYTFRNELFAPLLSVVCIHNIEEGIACVNSSEYGLTAGLQSLNEDEQALWRNRIEAGNLYINRGITGAIVRRQPFGGMKRSAFGGGIKAGGPNYVSCFLEFTERPVSSGNRVAVAKKSYQEVWENEFSKAEDVSRIYGEENIFRYLPLKNVGFRVQETDQLEDVLLVLLAAHTAHTPLTVSISEKNSLWVDIQKAAASLPATTLKMQDEAAFILDMHRYERIRACSIGLSDDVYRKAAELGKYVADARPLLEGRLELLHYLKEQSIAYEYHRYGSIFGE